MYSFHFYLIKDASNSPSNKCRKGTSVQFLREHLYTCSSAHKCNARRRRTTVCKWCLKLLEGLLIEGVDWSCRAPPFDRYTCPSQLLPLFIFCFPFFKKGINFFHLVLFIACELRQYLFALSLLGQLGPKYFQIGKSQYHISFAGLNSTDRVKKASPCWPSTSR